MSIMNLMNDERMSFLSSVIVDLMLCLTMNLGPIISILNSPKIRASAACKGGLN